MAVCRNTMFYIGNLLGVIDKLHLSILENVLVIVYSLINMQLIGHRYSVLMNRQVSQEWSCS